MVHLPCWFLGAFRIIQVEQPRRCLDYAEIDARLIFSCGWHISRDGKDVYFTRSVWVKILAFSMV